MFSVEGEKKNIEQNRNNNNLEFCTLINLPSTVKEKQSFSEANKIWGNMLPVDMPCKKC